MNKIYYTLIKTIIVIAVLFTVIYSIYQKVQEKADLVQRDIGDANELLKSSREHRKVQYVGNEKLGYLLYNDKSNIYFKNLKDTVHILQLIRMADSTKIMQKYGKIK